MTTTRKNSVISQYRLKDFSVELSKFSEEEIAMLLEEKYFDFSVSRFLELKNIYYQCSIEFAVKYKVDLLDNLGECELAKSDILQFLRRNEFTQEDYIQLLRQIATSEVDAELALILRGFKFELPKEYVEAAWEALDEDDKYQLLDNQLDAYNLDEIAVKFGILGGDYKQFENRNRHRYTLHSNDFNKSICNKLLARNFLSSCEEKTTEKFDPVTSQTEIQTKITGYVKRK